MRTRVKVCGLTNVEDAVSCAQLGVDAIGLNFYAKSPRHISLDTARAIAVGVPPFVTLVALFVNPQSQEVKRVIETVGVSLLQFHGDEPAGFCGQFGVPYIKACRMKAGVDLLESMQTYGAASAWLADAYSDQYGGAGKQFDWTRLPRECPRPLVLSGGLSPENAGEAVRRVRPWALDVCSGVESSKGVKDRQRVAAFITEVRNADE